MFRWWPIREIRWCEWCTERECNGKSDLCAQCEAKIRNIIDGLEGEWRS